MGLSDHLNIADMPQRMTGLPLDELANRSSLFMLIRPPYSYGSTPGMGHTLDQLHDIAAIGTEQD